MSYPVLSLFKEASAYEALWDRPNASFRTIAIQLSDFPQNLASSLIDQQLLNEYKKILYPILKALPRVGVRI
jgi:hypothetical protein